jgi:hypothetical protein
MNKVLHESQYIDFSTPLIAAKAHACKTHYVKE